MRSSGVMSYCTPSMSWIGSDGESRVRRKVRTRIPRSVGIAMTSRRAIKRARRGPRSETAPELLARAPSPLIQLLLEPPLLDVPNGAVGRGVEVLELLVRVRQGIACEQERVRDVVVELLVDGVERLLASGLAAVGAVSVVEKRLVDLRVRVEDVVELVLARLAQMPDRVRIRIGPERP